MEREHHDPELQHFILRFNKISLLSDTSKRGVRGERRPKDKVNTG
jgi:hypothetical protein